MELNTNLYSVLGRSVKILIVATGCHYSQTSEVILVHLNMKCFPKSSCVYENLVPSCYCCLGGGGTFEMCGTFEMDL